MRLVEKCCCGASIELSWQEPDGYHQRSEKMRESERAKTEASTFRKNHKNCRIMHAASSQDTKPGSGA